MKSATITESAWGTNQSLRHNIDVATVGILFEGNSDLFRSETVALQVI